MWCTVVGWGLAGGRGVIITKIFFTAMHERTKEVANKLEVVRGPVVKRISLAIVQQERHIKHDGNKQSELMRLEDKEP